MTSLVSGPLGRNLVSLDGGLVCFDGVRHDGSVVFDVDAGVVVDGASLSNTDSLTRVDCSGSIISAGLVDLQFNGGWGVDFSAGTVTTGDVARVLQLLPTTGVTTVVPTLISSSRDVYAHAITVVRAVRLPYTSSCVPRAPRN